MLFIIIITECSYLKMKLLHQAEPPHSNFSVNGWTTQLSGPGWISNTHPTVRLIVLSQGTPLEMLYRGWLEHLRDLSLHTHTKSGFAKPSHRAFVLWFPATAIPKSVEEKKSPLLHPVPYLVSSKRWVLGDDGEGCQAALPPGVVVGGNPAAPAKLGRKSCHAHLYM